MSCVILFIANSVHLPFGLVSSTQPYHRSHLFAILFLSVTHHCNSYSPCSVFCCYLGSYLSSKGKSRFYIYDFEAPKNGLWAAKKPNKIGLFAGYIFFVPS